MIIYPKCKINIGLNVVSKRADGFHNLESLFVDETSPSDILEIVESDKLSLSLYGTELDCDIGSNICVKGYNLLKQDFDLPPVHIHLYKKIPVGAGLGGGSSDGASTLILLNKLFDLGLNTDNLVNYASLLGSDCPFFIYSNLNKDNSERTCMYVTGRGDILESFPVEQLSDVRVEIVSPPLFVSTAEAYSGVVPSRPKHSLKELLKLPVDQWKDLVVNDFEKHIFEKYPLLQEEKMRLYEKGALYASMSGSGSSLYGLFKKINTP